MIELDVYQNYTARIDETMRRVLEDQDDPNAINQLLEIGRYTLSSQGKMLRGVMLLEACRTVGGNPEHIMYAATGTEYGHLASLIHDDMIDQDELRRGQRTIWSKYGADYALLIGDLFIFEAYYCLARCRYTVPAERVARALEVLARACIDLCFGQALEAQLQGNDLICTEDYIKMVRSKTGSLFCTALESGAILGGGTEEQIAAIREYGENLGIAFQIVDDVLSYTSHDNLLRKPTISDTKNRRITLPVLYALETTDQVDRGTLQKIFVEAKVDGELAIIHGLVTAILHRSGAIHYAKQVALDFQRRALQCLTLLEDNPGRQCLDMIARIVVERQQ